MNIKTNTAFKRNVRKHIARTLMTRHIKSRRKKSNKRRAFQGLRRCLVSQFLQNQHKLYKYTQIKAPSVLSLISNQEEVLKFIQEIQTCYLHKRKVFILLNGVKEITEDAIVILLSKMFQFRTHNIEFNGDFPLRKKVCDKLIDSGFFSHLYENITENNAYDIHEKHSSLYTHAQKAVTPDKASDIIKSESTFIWGEPRRCQGAQKVFIELMHNTNNHAGQEKGDRHWWVSVSRNEKEKSVTFSFLDFGKGIFNSLYNKKPDDKFYGWSEIFKKMFPFAKTDDEKLRLILRGELHKTCTKAPYRGKGLHKIYQEQVEGNISDLIIITNSVYANVAENKYGLLKNELIGTFVSWKIKPNTPTLPWKR